MVREVSATAYRPKLPADDWAAIEEYVRSVIHRVEPEVVYSARELYPAVTQLVHFTRTSSAPVEDDVVFDPVHIGRFINHHLASYNRASRNTIRARLRRVSETLLGDGAAGKFKALGKADASRPYVRAELAVLDAWAWQQRTMERRTSAGALLALGLGAGLTGAEIIAARTSDITDDGTSVSVHGAASRTVPLLHEWTTRMRERTDFIGSDGWVFRAEQRGGNTNLITDFVSRKGPTVQLQARRMRATWLAHHLEAGTPLKRLLRVAGLRSAEALDRVLPFVEE
ncbi:hypothetical protein [Curtobacterium sp. MCBA15_012]|uniref:hypothetical protein n=1 Tax=Curtobacterium sp. MCBA15_012 TaxID=1898738 RepID=UPI0008DD7218|nr:hypothetical protein [Curtobacterium sp. MCBA15_012]WIB00258.1 hypothetical protein QOL15_00805 [Curtobacterium sp. MCBA15_012]